MNNNLSNIYKKIFETYLNFCPYYRRHLVDLNDMYRWLEDIDFKNRFFSSKYDFYILMEWFNAVELIKPLAVLSYPPETFKDAQFPIRTSSNSSELDQFYKDGLISFPEDIYNLTNKARHEIKPWQYRVYKPQIDNENDYRNFFEYDLDHYLYHPIQFFQVITYLRGSVYQILKKKKEYIEFYWKRMFNFEDSVVNEIEKYLKENELTKEQYIKQLLDKGRGFHQLEAIYFNQHRWLIEKALLLWIKFENFYRIKFLRPSNSHEINIELQISQWDSNKDELYDKMFKKYREWYMEVSENFTNYFSVEDFKILKGFITWTEVQLDIDGLDRFKDLFLLISKEKKSMLKGFLSFYVNILQIVKTLKFFQKKYVKSFPELKNENIEPKWYEPKYLFTGEQEKIEYLQKVYLDYGLTQKDTYLLYVEGPTELILLTDWLDIVYYRTKVKINVKTLPSGKSSASVFEYLANNFDANEHFLMLDEDKQGYAEGKKNQLRGKGISDDSFYIFSPDFITENFEPEDIIKALKGCFNEISDKIYEATEQKLILTEADLRDFAEILENKEKFDKYENLVENFLSLKLQNPSFELRKTDFARHLLSIMRNNFSQTNRSKKYPFEEIISKFAIKIQKKQFPRIDPRTEKA